MTQSVRARSISAKAAGRDLATRSSEDRSALLQALVGALRDPARREVLAQANREDVASAEAEVKRGTLEPALLHRLTLGPAKLDGLADGVAQLASRGDPVGERVAHRLLDEDLVLEQLRCPLGVLGVVFESRPDAVVQIASLALRTGNAVLLKGGREARRSNRALVELLRDVIATNGVPPDTVVLLEERSEVAELLTLHDQVAMIVARGSGAFVAHVMRNSEIPVLGHAEGLCHTFLHSSAQPEMAARILVDAKCSYPAACNATETLLWQAGAERALEQTLGALADQGVSVRGCEATRALHPNLDDATADDWSTEYGAAVLSVRRVGSLEDALAHIAEYGSGHTEAIVAEDKEAAEAFLASVDAAGVFHNASTRFADGYRYGLGAEVGVSTSKLHARGPVGIDGLLTTRYVLRGTGQVTTDYGAGKKLFVHRDLGTETTGR